MAMNNDFISSANAAEADEESAQATWVETAVAVIFAVIAALIVASISVIMAMA